MPGTPHEPRTVRGRVQRHSVRGGQAVCGEDAGVRAPHRAVPVRGPRHALPRHGLRFYVGDQARVGEAVQFELSIINGKTVFDIIRAHRDECIGIVQNAYLAHAHGQSVNPDSYFLRFPGKPDCRIIALPAYLGNGFHVAGLKWIASYPGNVQRGFPRASAVLVLNNYDTGYPFAIFESSIISAARTAASAVLAAYWLNGRSRRAHSLGIVGTGFIARYVYDFLVDTGWEIEEVRLYDVSPLESEKFRNTACRPERHRAVTVAPDVEQLVRGCDVIVFATVATTPHIADPALFEHNPVVLHISLRDLAPQILLASQNVVDDVDPERSAQRHDRSRSRLRGGARGGHARRPGVRRQPFLR